VRPDPRFLNQPKHFWANVRSISEAVGYTARKTHQIRVPTLDEMRSALEKMNLGASHLMEPGGRPTTLGATLRAYFKHRATVLNDFVKPRLMNAQDACSAFNRLARTLKPECPLPMNKQKGKKRARAYFTGIINMLIEANARGLSCDYDPRKLTTFTRDGTPLRTLARRIDGAFPSPVNPIAVWEIKDYYYTTTFGSRIADGVYETLLDGMELEELREKERVEVKHYLMLDAHYTWWECGRSYLCRIIDMLHMAYVDEVLFGAEVIERLPGIVKAWVALARTRIARRP
jgi:hypothetical protein